jgi:type IV pilus assembly protein PilX
VVLIVSLVILVVMTIVGVTAMRGTALEERMAGNLRDGTLAFEAAEAALRAAGDLTDPWASKRSAGCPPASADEVFDRQCLPVSPALEDLVDRNAAGEFEPRDGVLEYPDGIEEGGDIDGVVRQPVYVVHDSVFVPDTTDPNDAALGIGRYFYAVTALGFGSTDESTAMLQAVIAKRFR